MRLSRGGKNDTFHGSKNWISDITWMETQVSDLANNKLKTETFPAESESEPRATKRKLFVMLSACQPTTFSHSLSLLKRRELETDLNFFSLLSFPYTRCKVDKWVGIKRSSFLLSSFFVRFTFDLPSRRKQVLWKVKKDFLGMKSFMFSQTFSLWKASKSKSREHEAWVGLEILFILLFFRWSLELGRGGG